MAVIDGIPHITARVVIAGELATEYEGPDDFEMIDPSADKDTAPSKHCYIECKSGAEFAIEVTVSSGFEIPSRSDTIWFDVWIDGTRMRSASVRKYELPIEGQTTRTISDMRYPIDTKMAKVKKFVFAPITKNDSTSKSKIKEDALRAKGLGTIKIVVTTARDSKKKPGKSSLKPTTNQKSDFAGKALKGREITHATTFAETGTLVPKSVTVYVENQVDVGKFFFHYRSHEALQHEMIIPRTPSPKPPVVANDGEDILSHLSEAEIRRLAVERLRDSNFKQESSGIKREADENTPTPRPWKVAKLDDGKEAIDLTDD
ncbi:hypothetical protein FSPOR_3296 [Fusarium sporotrichioides]|uniref:DUF7918 domain-containing protein n=1 Tax=Fusarium sporotrichioides TaxID=5514 RepID=A0A395SH93_FUSSP|nr:hypothetical protein FSPOR_3296 [Fusarium sporotrichioides]